MPGTTPRGYPYPLPTEPVAEGAAAIRSLAEAIKGWQCLGEIDLSAAQTFSAIDQDFDHLRLIVRARGTANGSLLAVYLTCNGAGAGFYDYNNIVAYNNAVSVSFQYAGGALYIGNAPGADTTSGYRGAIDLLLPHYTLTPCQMTGHSYCWGSKTGAPTEVQTLLLGGTYRGSSPITSLGLTLSSGAFATTSRAWLYGISGI